MLRHTNLVLLNQPELCQLLLGSADFPLANEALDWKGDVPATCQGIRNMSGETMWGTMHCNNNMLDCLFRRRTLRSWSASPRGCGRPTTRREPEDATCSPPSRTWHKYLCAAIRECVASEEAGSGASEAWWQPTCSLGLAAPFVQVTVHAKQSERIIADRSLTIPRHGR